MLGSMLGIAFKCPFGQSRYSKVSFFFFISLFSFNMPILGSFHCPWSLVLGEEIAIQANLKRPSP